jgi:hypothetical protein
LRPIKHLRFLHDADGSLRGFEFEAPPRAEALQLVHQALTDRYVSILDTSTRLTPSALLQSIRLAEPGGEPLRGPRRHEIEAVLLEMLATLPSA